MGLHSQLRRQVTKFAIILFHTYIYIYIYVYMKCHNKHKIQWNTQEAQISPRVSGKALRR